MKVLVISDLDLMLTLIDSTLSMFGTTQISSSHNSWELLHCWEKNLWTC